jgi:hypothetical protein
MRREGPGKKIGNVYGERSVSPVGEGWKIMANFRGLLKGLSLVRKPESSLPLL